MISSKLYNILLSSYREYTGNDILNDGQPRISSRFYIRKPRRIQKRSNYYGYINTTVIVSELPVLRKYSCPDKIIIALTVFYDKKAVTLQHFRQRLESLGKLLRNLDKEEKGEKHFFIYFIAEKFRAGAEEESRRLYHRLNDNGYKAIVKTLTPRDNIFEIITKDITVFLIKRTLKLLSSPGFKYSDGKIFGYPKKFVEYIIILTSKLQGKEPAIDNIRRVREWPVKDLEQILIGLLPSISDPISSKPVNLSMLDPNVALIYKYRISNIKNQI